MFIKKNTYLTILILNRNIKLMILRIEEIIKAFIQ